MQITEAKLPGVSEGATWEVHPPAPVKPSDDCGPGQHLECNLMRGQESGPPAKPFPDS